MYEPPLIAGDLDDTLEERAEEQQPDHRLDERDRHPGGLTNEAAQVAERDVPAVSKCSRHHAASCFPERAAGVAEIDVVERRAGHRHRGDRVAGRLERGQSGWHGGCTVACPRTNALTVPGDLAQPVDPRAQRIERQLRRLQQLDLERISLQRALQLLRAARGDDAAAIDDRKLRSKLVGLFEVVRRQEDRHLLLGRKRSDLDPHVGARLWIEAGRRLIEEERLRLVDQAHRDVELPLHPAGVRLDRPLRCRRQVESLELLGNASAKVGAGEIVDRTLQSEVLVSGRLRVEAVLLPDNADRTSHAVRLRQARCDPRPAPRPNRGESAWSGSSPLSTCRPRSGRAGQRSTPPRSRDRARRAPGRPADRTSSVHAPRLRCSFRPSCVYNLLVRVS